MLIPKQQLQADTLNNLLKDFVTHDGSDNGDKKPSSA